MTTSAPVDVAVAFIEAFGTGDTDTIAGLVADDIVFKSPRVQLSGSHDVLAAMSEFAQVVEGVEGVEGVDIVAALGDEEKAVVVHDMRTAPFGTMRAVDYLVIRDGKIQSDNLVFDTYEVRRAEQA